MEDDNRRKKSTQLKREDTDQSARNKPLMNYERSPLEVNLEALKRKSNTDPDLTKIYQNQKDLDAVDYFKINGDFN